jgi:hypothetical protein
VGWRHAGTLGGPGRGAEACRDVGPSCRADGVEVCRADGAEACQDLGRMPAGPMGQRCARTRGVPGCGAEVCRPDGVGGVVVGG